MFAKYSKYHLLFLVLLVIAAVLNLVIGSVRIPVTDVLEIVIGNFSG